ncbi:IclR family transcriptional regulator C-terminal domain-containing protein [Streptomyces sp. NPDC026673]|uniref:IclR family transcriptional regulator domain-containing protein n=1 Tax=Streptomyces sp. NPDC026673 TaxID=3155724 RepID=UPI0033F8F913
MTETERRDYVQSLERGLSVITAFSQGHPQMNLSEVAAATGLSKPTARRLLLTLRELGYVRAEGTRYALTPKVLGLGYAYLSSLNITEVAQPFMESLTEELQEGTSLAALDDTDVVYVNRVQRHRITSISLAVGTRLPAHATSMGHVLLAGLGPEALESYLAKAVLRPMTGRTLTTRAALEERLRTVREQGWAAVDQELEVGRRSAAAPVRDANGRVIAALALSNSTADRTFDQLLSDYVPPLVRTAGHISAALGGGSYRVRTPGPPPRTAG